MAEQFSVSYSQDFKKVVFGCFSFFSSAPFFPFEISGRTKEGPRGGGCLKKGGGTTTATTTATTAATTTATTTATTAAATTTTTTVVAFFQR